MMIVKRINGPPSLVSEMQKRSGITYDQAEVALTREWLGRDNETTGERIPDTIAVKAPSAAQSHSLPLSIFGMGPKANDHKDSTNEVKVPKTYGEAKDIVTRFENGAPRKDDMVADTVSQHLQNDITSLSQEQWMGSEQEEVDA